MKKFCLGFLAIFAMIITGCMSAEKKDTITVVSREASSGTRTAFDEMVGIAVKQGNVVKDNLFPEALISGSSSSVGMTVANEPNAIGYTSLVSVGSAPKIVSINGVMPDIETIMNETYSLHRPFLLVLQKETPASPEAQDFVNFVISKEGQDVVHQAGYVQIRTDAAAYAPASNLSGKIVLSGSTSVEPVMAKLEEAYKAVQRNVQVEIQYTGSTAGLKDVGSGKVQLGLSSRNLTAEESATSQAVPFANDAIAVIVNKKNPITDLTIDQLRSIFTGEVRTWSEVSKEGTNL